MRTEFPGFYSPTSDEYGRLWKEARVVLDTNVLLDLYRLPKVARDELLSVLDGIKERLWLPYQVALEFQRRRLTVISAERKNTEAALSEAGDLVGKISSKVSALQIDKYDLGLDPRPLISDLESANKKIIEAITSVHQSKLDIASIDPIRERLDSIFSGRIGPAPKDQSDLDAMVADGDQRYADKIPPGWLDVDKDKNPSEATFFHRGIKYQRKFGDLILWRQTINWVKEKEIKSVILVTSDRKQDWWLREQGKTLGPQPDLVEEIASLSGVESFWMYSSDQFLEHAKLYASAKVSDETVTEVREVKPHSWRMEYGNHLLEEIFRDEIQSDWIIDGARPYANWMSESSSKNDMTFVLVGNWLEKLFPGFAFSLDFPEIVVSKVSDYYGFGVEKILQPRDLLGDVVIDKMHRGANLLAEGGISYFVLVAVASMPSRAILGSKNIRAIISNFARTYPRLGFIIGSARNGSAFVPVLKAGRVPAEIGAMMEVSEKSASAPFGAETE